MFGTHLAGIYEKAFDERDSWETRLGKAKELGFDYVEISIDEKDHRIQRLYWEHSKVEELRRICYESGIGIQSMCLSAHRRFPFGSGDPAVRKKAHDIMERAIDFANALGIRVIQLAGYDVYYEESTPESIKRFRQGMKWAADQAARQQVMLAMEIMDTPFMNSITKHQGYEAQIRSPWYKVYPDLGNLSAWGENDPLQELEGGISSIVGVHVKETIAPKEGREGKFKEVPFGTGCVDFPACFQKLEQLGYRGPYMIEMWHRAGTEDVAEVRRAAEWLESQYRLAADTLRDSGDRSKIR